jgi:hypothetical protein
MPGAKDEELAKDRLRRRDPEKASRYDKTNGQGNDHAAKDMDRAFRGSHRLPKINQDVCAVGMAWQEGLAARDEE